MIDSSTYGEWMAGYLHLNETPIYATLGFGRSELAVTRFHAPNGFSMFYEYYSVTKGRFQSTSIFARTREAVGLNHTNFAPPATLIDVQANLRRPQRPANRPRVILIGEGNNAHAVGTVGGVAR